MHDIVYELPKGFRCSGSTCGIKESGHPDLSLFVSDVPATAAGVFTKNRVVGAPVTVTRSRVPRGDARAVVINSGNANACTGQEGHQNALTMTKAVADLLQCSAEQVLVCSTGIIGVQLPVDVILSHLPESISALNSDANQFRDAAVSMMTTDTFPKLAMEDCRLPDGQTVRISGAAKGAAMIAPNMATMLSVIMTDVRLTETQAAELLAAAVSQTFNCISVDRHTSTSDTVLLLANGAAVDRPAEEDDLAAIQRALTQVCEKLATDIIRDAEGADHFITVHVNGLETEQAATAIAREIADSPLVKTAVAGADPNWGRIVSAAGYAGVDFEADYVSLLINDTLVYRDGMPVSFDETSLSAELRANREVTITLSIAGGPCSGSSAARFWTSDLTTEYVRLNSDYTT